MNMDIRWLQRFINFKKTFRQLKDAVEMEGYTDLEREGLIQRFENTYDLAWKTMKDFLENKGYTNIIGSKDATREAFQAGLIIDGEAWMEMLESRNLTSHTYDEETAEKISEKVKAGYYYLFEKLFERLEKEQ
jgi:nucleotidyltransferase substrate binding protein (TIGR01987 family)